MTDEFIAFMKASPDLSRTTEFLVVAATLLDMKAAHLLPRIDEEDNASEADLEARDLLFSRLLQYRAFKEAAKSIDQRMGEYGSYVARDVPLEAHFASLLPELRWLTTPKILLVWRPMPCHLRARRFRLPTCTIPSCPCASKPSSSRQCWPMRGA